MVTARETADSKVIAMDDRAGRTAAPPRTLLEEVNAHLVCALCQGYYIDATTIVECLHSFCRSCIIKHLQKKSYCPVCEMMINSAKPNIKPDKALQDIVYKLVPGLFQREMRRRQEFYSSRPGPAAGATPEQRGEDTERIIFSPEDVISFSLEYIEDADAESASSRSSESGNESTPCNEAGAPTRRYFQCPAVVNVSHLKKFLSMKYDVDVAHFSIDILYKRVPLTDYHTLMDIAYIYNWKRNEPMRFFYQITDSSVIRDRLGYFGANRPGSRAHRRKTGPSDREGTAPDSPAPLTEGGSDYSEGSRSPPPGGGCAPTAEASVESQNDKESGSLLTRPSAGVHLTETPNTEFCASSGSSPTVDVEKSQFLNSFELTAKSSVGKNSGSPLKEEALDDTAVETKSPTMALKSPIRQPKPDTAMSPSKRKSLARLPEEPAEPKKPRLLLDKNVKDVAPKTVGKANQCDAPVKSVADALAENCSPQSSKSQFSFDGLSASRSAQTDLNKNKMPLTISTNAAVRSGRPEEKTVKTSSASASASVSTSATPSLLKVNLDSVPKKCLPTPDKIPLKRKASDGLIVQSQSTDRSKLTLPKVESTEGATRLAGRPTPIVPKISKSASDSADALPKLNAIPKIVKPENIRKPPEPPKEIPRRLDTSSPRQPRPPMKLNIPKPKSQGDPLKTLFDSCNINIPSSLSITLTDQKIEQGQAESSIVEMVDTQKTSQSTGKGQPPDAMDTPSPPVVHNYIEILKLPDLESSKSSESEKNVPNFPNKSGDAASSAKGPVPKLKPIGDTKQTKAGTFTKPKTFQQTFLQSLQQQCEKPKYLKTRIEYPKINPGQSSSAASLPTGGPPLSNAPTPAVTPAASTVPPAEGSQEKASPPVPPLVLAKSKLVPISQPVRKFCNILPKPDSALDLSTPHTGQSQLGPQQTKALETMQSIANLAKKQSFSQRMASPSQVFSQESFKMNTSNVPQLRIPVPPPKQLKPVGNNSSVQATSTAGSKQAPEYYPLSKSANVRSNNGGVISNPKSDAATVPFTQSSQRSLTRSPSSSPKLVIACSSPKSQSPERKRLLSPRTIDNGSQSNLISSSQISSTNHAAAEAPGGSKEIPKTGKPKTLTKPSNSRSSAPRPSASAHGSQDMSSYTERMSPHQAYILQQLELQTRLGLLPPGAAAQWYNNPAARAHFERIMKNNPQ